MIPLKIHNVLDYFGGAILLVAPSLFDFSYLLAARNLFWFLGAALIVYSLLTDYYYSLAKWIPVKAHLGMDSLVGLLLILGPSVLGYRLQLDSLQYALHFALGLGLLGLVILTNRQQVDILDSNSKLNRPATPRV
jgi:hypothetical protein